MRRVQEQRASVKQRGRRTRDEVEERPAERPEIRQDVRRLWWPDD
ncbi:hypothetical protein [Streptomyces sp. NPDC058045]